MITQKNFLLQNKKLGKKDGFNDAMQRIVFRKSISQPYIQGYQEGYQEGYQAGAIEQLKIILELKEKPEELEAIKYEAG